MRSGTALRLRPFSAAKARVMASRLLVLSLTDVRGTDSGSSALTAALIVGSTPYVMSSASVPVNQSYNGCR